MDKSAHSVEAGVVNETLEHGWLLKCPKCRREVFFVRIGFKEVEDAFDTKYIDFLKTLPGRDVWYYWEVLKWFDWRCLACLEVVSGEELARIVDSEEVFDEVEDILAGDEDEED